MESKKYIFWFVSGFVFIVLLFTFLFRVLSVGVGSYYKEAEYPLRGILGNFVHLDSSIINQLDDCQYQGLWDIGSIQDNQQAIIHGLLTHKAEDTFHILVNNGEGRPRIWRVKDESITINIADGSGNKCVSIVVDYAPKPPEWAKAPEGLTVPEEGYFVEFAMSQTVFSDLTKAAISADNGVRENIINSSILGLMILNEARIGLDNPGAREINYADLLPLPLSLGGGPAVQAPIDTTEKETSNEGDELETSPEINTEGKISTE